MDPPRGNGPGSDNICGRASCLWKATRQKGTPSPQCRRFACILDPFDIEAAGVTSPSGIRDKSHMNSRTAVDTNAVLWRSRTGILAIALTAVIVVAVSFAPYPTSVPISGGCAAASYGAIVDAAPPNSAISFCERGNADRLSIATTVPMYSGPRVAAIVSVVETCRRLKIPIREYLCSILPGLTAPFEMDGID